MLHFVLWVMVVLQGAEALSFTTIARGAQSGVAEPREAVIRTAGEWEALWKAHNPAQPLPSVDFSRSMVIGVFLGNRPTAGHAAEITRISTDSERLTVEYADRRPAPGALTAQVITTPFHLVVLPRDARPARFQRFTSLP